MSHSHTQWGIMSERVATTLLSLFQVMQLFLMPEA